MRIEPSGKFGGARRARAWLAAGTLGALWLGACVSDDESPATPTLDAGGFDASVKDASTSSDAQASDVVPSDGGVEDATVPTDAGLTDAALDAAVDAPSDAASDSAIDAADAATCVGLHFLGANDTVQAPIDGGVDFGAATTVEMWVYEDAVDGGAGTLFNKWTNFQEDKFISMSSNGSVYVYLHAPPSPPVSVSTTGKVTQAKWTHLALVNDSTSARFYIDGTKSFEVAGPFTIANSTGPVQIGHVSRDYESPPTMGFISEVRHSKVARYTANFAPAAHLASDSDTQAFWKLDEGTGTVASDSSGNGHPGTISGATWQPVPCR